MRLDLLPVRSLPNKTPVVVEAALYHGATQLCDICCTSQYPVNGLLRMKELMTFKIAKKDVPKVIINRLTTFRYYWMINFLISCSLLS